MLNGVGDVNTFQYIQVAQCTSGDQVDIYFQLVDASKNLPLPNDFFSPSGLRFMPAAGSILQVVLKSIDDARTVTRYATQPFALDPSIWRLTLLSSDQLVGTFGLQLTLTQPGPLVTRGYLAQAIQIASTNPTFC